MQFFIQQPKHNNKLDKSILILFKFKSRWNDHVIIKLSLEFNVYWCYIHDSYQQIGSVAFSKEILKFSSEYKIAFIILDIEFFPSFHLASIELLRNGKSKVGVMLFDDGPLHLLNRIFASRTDFVLTGCPLSSLKYHEMGIPSAWFPLETESLYFLKTTDKTIDLLFFGNSTKTDRSKYLNAIKKQTKLSTVIFDPAIDGFLDQSSFAQLLSSSKVIINLSKSEIVTDSIISSNVTNITYQLKGRVLEALFSGSLCVSEYAPQHQLLNINKHLSEFKTAEELIERVEAIDFNPFAIQEKYSDFYECCWPIYCDKSIINNIYQFLEEILISSYASSRVNNNIDARYLNSTNIEIKTYFNHNPHLRDEELSLLSNCI